MNPTTETIDLSPLRDEFAGALHTAADPGWDEARSAWNLAVDQHPAVVAIPEDAADVARAVRFARDHGIRVAAQGTGHNAAAHGDLAGVMLIKTERMRDVRIEPATKTARVGAGVTWGEVVGPAAEHGLAALAGSSHDVGVVGYTLGGGVSWLARKHGLGRRAGDRDRGRQRPRRPPRGHGADRSRPVLGAARRRRQLRRRHGDGVLPPADHRGLRGRALVPRTSAPERSSRRGGAGRCRCRTRSPRSAG